MMNNRRIRYSIFFCFCPVCLPYSFCCIPVQASPPPSRCHILDDTHMYISKEERAGESKRAEEYVQDGLLVPPHPNASQKQKEKGGGATQGRRTFVVLEDVYTPLTRKVLLLLVAIHTYIFPFLTYASMRKRIRIPNP